MTDHLSSFEKRYTKLEEKIIELEVVNKAYEQAASLQCKVILNLIFRFVINYLTIKPLSKDIINYVM